MATLTPLLRQEIDKLKKIESVDSINISYRFLEIKFNSGITEVWQIREGKRRRNCFSIPNNKVLIDDVEIPTFKEFESNIFDNEKNKINEMHFSIPYRTLNSYRFGNIRIKVHQLVKQLSDEGWIDLEYTDDYLTENLENIKADENKFINNKVAHVLPSGINRIDELPNLCSISKFAELSGRHRRSIRELWSSNTMIYRSINNIIKYKEDITRTNIVKHLTKVNKDAGPKFISGRFYNEFFRKTIGSGYTILDMCPKSGSKALGAEISGNRYMTYDDKIFINNKYKWDGKNVDYIILNDYFYDEYETNLDKVKGMDSKFIIYHDRSIRSEINDQFEVLESIAIPRINVINDKFRIIIANQK